MPRIADIEDNLLPKTDSQNLEFLSALESGVSSGGGVYVVNPSTGTPMNVSSDPQYVGTTTYAPNFLFNIISTEPNVSVVINGENTFKNTPNSFNISTEDVLKQNNQYTIEVLKEGYVSADKYVLNVLFDYKYYKDDTFVKDLVPVDNTYNPFDNFGNPVNRFDGQARRSSEPVYSTDPIYTIRITKYENGIIVPFEYEVASQVKELSFSNFSKTGGIDPSPSDELESVDVNLNGSDFSSILIINDNERIELRRGLNQLGYPSGTKIEIVSSNLETYRINSISITEQIGVAAILARRSRNNTQLIEAENTLESVSTNFILTQGVGIEIEALNIDVSVKELPSIFLTNIDELTKYNINTKEGLPIVLRKTGNLTSLRVVLNSQTIQFGNPFGESDTAAILIPEKYFTTLGVYQIVIIPTIDGTDADFVEFKTNVVDDVYVGTPDIRNILYPSLIRGKDYVGYDVDFEIEWESINTDYVLIKPLGTVTSTKVQSSGRTKLNYKSLLELSSSVRDSTTSGNSLTLVLTPYNISGKEPVVGKEELITINFQEGTLKIPKETAINRIAEGFLLQLDDSIFDEENSKYLTHLLHFGDGNNKIITTWVGDRESLILKLYEPVSTAIQPNDQVWISKLQSNPIVETITITGLPDDVCPPLKGPNFSIQPDNGIGFTVFEDLIASGSVTSNDIANRYLESVGVDTAKLNIQYVSGSQYTFENFSHFGAAAERVENFFYKIQIIERLKNTYAALTETSFNGGGVLAESIPNHEIVLTLDGAQILTEDSIYDIQWEVQQFAGPSQANQAKKVLSDLNQALKNLDGFEYWLYKSIDDLAYPKILFVNGDTGLPTYILREATHPDVVAWYEALIGDAVEYDKYNPNLLRNNVPEFIYSDYENEQFLLFLDMIGQHFDIIWSYINALNRVKVVEEKVDLGIPDDLIWHLLKSFGWDGKRAFDSQFVWEYAFGQYKDGFQKYSMSLEEANNQVWRRIINNLPYLLKHKGTARAMKAIMACYGVPQSLLTIMEFGGPQDPSVGGSRQFTFEDRTAAIYLTESSSVKIPWKSVNGNVPAAIEFNFKPSSLPNTQYTLISSSQWTLDLIQTTGSFGRLELNFGGDVSNTSYILEPFASGSPVVTTYYFDTASYYPFVYGPDLTTGSLGFPISTEYYSNICINRTDYAGDGSLYEVWLGTSNGDRIVTSVSMSIFTEDSQWVNVPSLQIGGNGFKGNVDEFRLWRIPLERGKFNSHVLQPDSIAGNSYTSSTEDLLFRLDFEYPKDRTADSFIKNVAINQTYGEPFASTNNMYSASVYPYQYTPYERTVTATVPSLGFNYSNKIRFEEQTLVSNLSYKTRATKKSFDRAPIDSNRLGLFFSPIKELNMDIVKAFGEFNIDNYIGDPSDEYRDSYKELEGLRTYYFERLDRNINEYIQLVRYINKSLFDVLTDLAPARAKVSKGLLIEPHYLERSKVKWDRPTALQNNYDTNIDTNTDVIINSTFDVYNGELDAETITNLVVDVNNYDTTIEVGEETILDSAYLTYAGTIDAADDTILEATAPFYDVEIDVPTGATLSGEADSYGFEIIGMEKDSISNLGFGLYGKSGFGIYKKYDIFGNFTQSRQNIYLVKEQYSRKVSTQTAGYPRNGALPGEQVKYQDVLVPYTKYRVSLMPFSGSISIGNEIVSVTPLNGYLPSHYRYTNNLGEGMIRSFWKGSQQNSTTTPDGLPAVEIFTTNPNILRVAKTGRGSGEPILEVD
jgi:hypothetical protein